MALLIAESFFGSLTKLQAKESARAIEFVTRFQANPKNPGISLERLSGKSKALWSGRITQELRCIMYKDGDNWALLHAGHHDAAYQWAERRDVGRHPVTGMIEVVERVESVEELRPVYDQPAAAGLLDEHAEDYLLSLGVPENWMPTLRKVRDEDQLLLVAEKLPAEVAERLLLLATGELVTPPLPLLADTPALEHPDVRRRFFVADNSDELLRALEAPLDKWISFLHPTQRAIVTADYRGPAKVTGSAGTGKTIVALHRARHLARQGHRVLVCSYVRTLCENLERALDQLCAPAERSQISVSTVHAEARRLVAHIDSRAHVVSDEQLQSALEQELRHSELADEPEFVQSEWKAVILAQGIRSWPEYRKAKRVGRGKALTVADRKRLWEVFGATLSKLEARHGYSWPTLCRKAQSLLEEQRVQSGFDAVIVDEVQDLGRAELQLIAELGRMAPHRLLLVGDNGQRIYAGGHSLSALGIDVRGRSKILRVNYRTTEQIRRAADAVLIDAHDRDDDDVSQRLATTSLLSGPRPSFLGVNDDDAQCNALLETLRRWIDAGMKPGEIAVFARTHRNLERLESRLHADGRSTLRLADTSFSEGDRNAIALGTMHRAKGLEFKAVAIVGCSERELPSPQILKHLRDPQDRQDAIARERRLFYVAMTRARDELAVFWTGAASPFLAPLISGNTVRRRNET